ncbi:hypothetical protein HDU76_004994 [Blyttiomyces sp. JEL0837]|nr:hypothetical protein HDU76_004994 [Blyttiomyces sp. JEL0837]
MADILQGPPYRYNPNTPTSLYDDAFHRQQAIKAESLRQLASHGATQNAADFFEYCVDKHGDQLAVKAVDFNTSYTFRSLDESANRIAWWAMSPDVGVKAGDTIALLMENRPEYLAMTMGFAKAGATIALLNTNLVGPLLTHAITTSKAKLVISSIGKRDNLLSAITDGPEKGWKPSVLTSQKSMRPEKSIRDGLTARTPLYYIFTSGTTGPSKAAKFSHRRFIGAAVTWSGPSGLKRGENYYITLPLYHGNAGVVAVAPCYFIGNGIVLRQKFSVTNFFKDIREHDCKATIYIGELWRYLHNIPPSSNEGTETFSPLKVAIGNGLRADIWESVVSRFALTQIIEHYGSTEMPGDAVLNYFNKPGSCGFLPTNVAKEKSMTGEGGCLVRYDVERDEVYRDPGTGFCIQCSGSEVGEMVMRLPGGSYDGYVGEVATQRKLYDGVFVEGDKWWSSGDLLQTDEQGFFYFVDRAGDSFRWKGENVSTNEVIASVATFEGIHECNVYGVKIPNTDGRAGMASILLDPDLSVDNFNFTQFTQHLAKKLPTYARPLSLRFRSTEHEKTSTMKFQKFKYAQQGYDPSKCDGDIVFVWNAVQQTWVKVGGDVLDKIANGHFRF